MGKCTVVSAGLVVVSTLFGRVAKPQERHDTAGKIIEEQAASYASFWFHGVSSISDSLRRRVSGDSVITDLYADLLDGKRHVSMQWDTATAVWWLAESGRPKYLPIFLRFADPSKETFFFAAYGLARHASIAEAEMRLMALAPKVSGYAELALVASLLGVNDAPARQVLRNLGPLFSQRYQSEIAAVLAAPPIPPREGRWPCSPGEVWKGGGSTPFRCYPNRQ